MTAPDWLQRTRAGHAAIRQIGVDLATARSAVTFGQVAVTDLGVPHFWGIQISAGGELPPVSDAVAAMNWASERGGPHRWCVRVPQSHVGRPPWDGLVARDSMGVYAIAAADAASLEVAPPSGFRLDLSPSYERVIDAYGGWMADEPLARLLVVPADLDLPNRRFIVGLVDDAVIGCAFVWWCGGTGYLSGIGVIEAFRGSGYGAALTIAASRTAVTESPQGEPDTVWMHATDDGAALYARLGYDCIDTEVLLTPP